MNRNDYLNLCRHCAMLKDRGLFGVPKNVPDSLRVVYKDIEYYPVAYDLSFDAKGDTIHSAVMHDLQANAIVTAPLERIQRKDEH